MGVVGRDSCDVILRFITVGITIGFACHVHDRLLAIDQRTVVKISTESITDLIGPGNVIFELLFIMYRFAFQYLTLSKNQRDNRCAVSRSLSDTAIPTSKTATLIISRT